MTIDARFGAIFAASLLLSGLALSSTARAETDSCSLLTPAQVGAAVGVPVGDGQHVTATSLKTCTWSPTGSSELRAVTLFLQTAVAYDGGKTMANQMVVAAKGVSMTSASVGDDGYFFVTGDQVGLLVKKGTNSFKVTVYANVPVDKKEAIELALAKEVIAKM
jgi:hypothetical protein